MSTRDELGQRLVLFGTRWWHRARRPVTGSRALFVALNRVRPSRRGLLVRPESVLTIEAPMRSGNTFAAASFMLMNPQAGHLARHIHTAAHALESVRLGVPTLVIVRDPRDVAISHVLRRPALTVADSLIDYSRFYEALEPVRSEIVAATFEDVTQRFDTVVEMVNRRFGTGFVTRRPDEAFQAQVLARVDVMNRGEHSGDGRVDEMRVARPSADRDLLRAGPAAELERVVNRKHVERAMAVYRRWT